MSRWLLALAIICGVAVFITLLVNSTWPFDQSLNPSGDTISRLKAMRSEPKFLDFPGAPAARERARMEPLINDLLDKLIAGIDRNPRRSWVLDSMQATVRGFYLEDTEVRERCEAYLERILQTVGIERTNCAFCQYFVFL